MLMVPHILALDLGSAPRGLSFCSTPGAACGRTFSRAGDAASGATGHCAADSGSVSVQGDKA
jgi:hypothetical protein